MKGKGFLVVGLINILGWVLLVSCSAGRPAISAGKNAVAEALREELAGGISCTYCQDSGKCPTCSGTGWLEGVECSECSGTGKCPLCGIRRIIRKEVVQFKETKGSSLVEPSGGTKKYVMSFQGLSKIYYDDNSTRVEEIKGEITFQKIMPWEETDLKWKAIYIIIKEKDCPYCLGNGKCITCKGTGKRSDGTICPACSGEGKCSTCRGTGIKSDW